MDLWQIVSKAAALRSICTASPEVRFRSRREGALRLGALKIEVDVCFGLTVDHRTDAGSSIVG